MRLLKGKFMKCEIDGSYNFGNTTRDIIAELEYDRDGYLDIISMQIKSCLSGEYIPASARRIRRFQNENWSYLFSECIKHSNYMAEMYRDEARDNRRKEAA
jgi:hypothetical protein